MTVLETNPATELLNKYREYLLDFDMLQSIPEPKWLIKDVLMQESVGVIWGDPAAGKSFITLDMALSVATGQNWFGKKTVPGNVLYIVGEGLAGIKLRANAWVTAHNKRPEGDQLYFLRRPVQLLDDLSPELMIQLLAEQAQVRLVVIDTLARSIVGHSENDNTDMGKLVDVAEQIKESTKATILFVHHSTKGQLRSMRGASALRGGIDTEIEMTYDESTKERVLHCRKQKDAVQFEDTNVYLQPFGKSVVPSQFENRGLF